jgi:SAM-dependent methyltransferase
MPARVRSNQPSAVVKVTGERVATPEGGFNPTWQRHVAAYLLCEPFLPTASGSAEERVLDLGCGVGHSYHLLEPRRTVGVDIDPGALAGQDRETVVADMRELPFDDASFSSLIAVHSLEHVPDPERTIAEAARVVAPGGVAIFVTPNRLTFGRPDEIIDPYHYVELDPDELRGLCATGFDEIEVQGIFGSAAYMRIFDADRVALDRMLGRDPLRLRRLVPRAGRQWLYDTLLRRRRTDEDPEAEAIRPEDFHLSSDRLEAALDLCAICRRPDR